MAPTAEEVRLYGNPDAAKFFPLLALWADMAKPGNDYYLALHDDKTGGGYRLWLEDAGDEWIAGRALAFTSEEHLHHYVGIVCRDTECVPSNFKLWTAKYTEVAEVARRISAKRLSEGGKGIRVDLCGVNADKDVVTADVLWDGLTT